MNNEIKIPPGVYITCSNNRVTNSQGDALIGCFRDRLVIDLSLQDYGRLRSTCKSFYCGLYKDGFQDIILSKISILKRFIENLRGKENGGYGYGPALVGRHFLKCKLNSLTEGTMTSLSDEEEKLLNLQPHLLHKAIYGFRLSKSYIVAFNNPTIGFLLNVSKDRSSYFVLIKLLFQKTELFGEYPKMHCY